MAQTAAGTVPLQAAGPETSRIIVPTAWRVAMVLRTVLSGRAMKPNTHSGHSNPCLAPVAVRPRPAPVLELAGRAAPQRNAYALWRTAVRGGRLPLAQRIFSFERERRFVGDSIRTSMSRLPDSPRAGARKARGQLGCHSRWRAPVLSSATGSLVRKPPGKRRTCGAARRSEVVHAGAGAVIGDEGMRVLHEAVFGLPNLSHVGQAFVM